MSNVIPLFPEKEKIEVHKFMPEKYWECGCGHCLYYLTPVEDRYELVCYGCGTTQTWN